MNHFFFLLYKPSQKLLGEKRSTEDFENSLKQKATNNLVLHYIFKLSRYALTRNSKRGEMSIKKYWGSLKVMSNVFHDIEDLKVKVLRHL